MFKIKRSLYSNKPLKPFLECKDHTVSQKSFKLLLDEDLEMLITSPQPDVDELGGYYESEAYISHTDSKKTLMDKVYQWVKNYTLQQKLKLINSFQTEEKTILDVGCGTGDFLLTCKNAGWTVNGVEPNEKARTSANKKLIKNIKNEKDPLNSDIEFYLNNKTKFDVISLWHVLEHIPNLNEYISFLKKLLKKDGVLIIAVPNYRSYDAQYYGKFWAAYDVPRHLWHFSKKSIEQIFKKQELKVFKILPMKFDSFYVSMLSEKYKNSKANLPAAFKIGAMSNMKAKKNFEYSSIIYLIKHS